MNRAAFSLLRRIWLLIAILALSLPASAEVHLLQVYSACPGDAQGYSRSWSGYAPPTSDTPVYAGSLVIDPGDNWRNYVAAAQASVAYTITGVKMQKSRPASNQCTTLVPAETITQTGTENIRLNWPLLYEVARTTWTLTIDYETAIAWDEDGDAGPSTASTTHTSTWVWHLDSDILHIGYLLSLLHDIEVGTGGVSAVNDEVLYADLMDNIELAQAAYEAGDVFTGAMILSDAELEIMDACTTTLPSYPDPTGPGTGVVYTAENPACCKLLSDIEYVFSSGG